jgi:hypothetical protein
MGTLENRINVLKVTSADKFLRVARIAMTVCSVTEKAGNVGAARGER